MNVRQNIDKGQDTNYALQELGVSTTVILPSPPLQNKASSKDVGTIYRASGNLLIIKESVKTVPRQFVGCTRNDIVAFSTGASTRMRRYLREAMSEYTTMVTLTYPFDYPSNGRDIKQHLKRFLQEIRRAYIRKGFDGALHSSFWFLEFQARGAPHFHVFTTWSPSKEWVAKRWYEIVNSEDIRHLHAGTRTEYLKHGRAGTISYASKYAAKQEQKHVPENYENVGRFWGVFGRRDVMAATTFLDTSERSQYDAKYQLERLFSFVNRALMEGDAEILVRKEGVCVVNLITKDAQRKARLRISMLGAMINRHEAMFCDAELDGDIAWTM